MTMIPVPYLSQWDETARLSVGDCGIVSVAMLAHWRGQTITADDLLRSARLPTGKSTYTFAELIQAGSTVRVYTRYVRQAKWADIKAEIDAGRPVIPLLRYGELSGNQDAFVGAHFFVVIGYDDENVIVNDPNFWGARRSEGHARPIPIVQFEKAIGEALRQTGNSPNQSLFLHP